MVYTPGRGFKLLDQYGRYCEFPDGATLTNYTAGRPVQNLPLSTYTTFTQTNGLISRLIKDPTGKVFWVENGQKRWITNGTAYQNYAYTRLTVVDWVVINSIPRVVQILTRKCTSELLVGRIN